MISTPTPFTPHFIRLYSFAYPCIHLFIHPLFIHLSVYFFTHLSIHSSFHSSVHGHPSLHQSIPLFIYSFIPLSSFIFPSIHHLSSCPSIHLFIHMFIHSSVHSSVYPFIHLHSFHPTPSYPKLSDQSLTCRPVPSTPEYSILSSDASVQYSL